MVVIDTPGCSLLTFLYILKTGVTEKRQKKQVQYVLSRIPEGGREGARQLGTDTHKSDADEMNRQAVSVDHYLHAEQKEEKKTHRN